MKYTILGSTGHISKPLTEKLIQEGHEVTLISSHAKKAEEITALGAKPAIGSIEDMDFLIESFLGADAVYTMIPPIMAEKDWKGYIGGVGSGYAHALKASQIKKVVNLSSTGAHLGEGAGPVSGSFRAEEALNQLEGIEITHLRPVYFYYNLLNNIDLIKHMGIMGSNFGNMPLAMVHPKDIAVAAAEELLSFNPGGHKIRYIAGDERDTDEIARVIGKAIGKPDLTWVTFKDQDSLNGMLQAGLPHEMASNLVEMYASIASGKFYEEYEKNKPKLSPVKLEDYMDEFLIAYQHA